MTFQDARLKLLSYVRNQVRNGEITERGFARLIGISQPHAHNVLKGVRSLSPELCDVTLKCLHLSLLDLAPVNEIKAHLERRRTRERPAEVAFLASSIGPGRAWPGDVHQQKRFPLPLPSAAAGAELMGAELAPDAAMSASLGSYNIALLDTSIASQREISPRGLYVVEYCGEAVIRYIRFGGCSYYLVTDTSLNHPMIWERLARPTVKTSDLVKARVLWLGRQQDHDLTPQGRVLYDPISS